MIELIRDYWNKRPCNIRHSQKPVGSKEYFEEVEYKRYFVEPHILDFAEFEKWRGKKVLEIGCGIGTDSIMFAKHGAILTCIDLSEESVALTKKRFEVYQLKADIFVANVEELSKKLSLQEFDLIYSFGVLHHTENPNKAIEEIKKFMGKETELRIMLYNKFSLKSFDFFIQKGYKFGFNFNKTIQFYAEAQLGCPRALIFTKPEIKKLLSGLNVIQIRKDHIFVYKIKEYTQNKYIKRFLFRLVPKPLFELIKKSLGWHFLIKAKLI